MPVKLKHTNKRTGAITYTDYYTVAERIKALHADDDAGPITIESAIVSEDANQITMAVTVTTEKGKFTAHAHSNKTAGGVEGLAPLEVAETSALGRALGFAGYGDGIASAEDMQRAGADEDEPASNGHLVQAAQEAGAKPTGSSAKSGWGNLWGAAKEAGLSREQVHELFSAAPETGALAALVKAKAAEQSVPDQTIIDRMAASIREMGHAQ